VLHFRVGTKRHKIGTGKIEFFQAELTSPAFFLGTRARPLPPARFAFGELYDRHRRKVYRTAFRILRNRQDAEDAVQRSFQRAFTNLCRFREDSTFSTWVTRIAINESLMMLRHRRADKAVQGIDDTEGSSVLDLADKGLTPEQALSENELRAAVIHAISHLREKLRTVVLLRELQGLTSAETARRLGLTVSAVKARTFHARRYLRKYLEPQYGPAGDGFRSERRV
jgi:RNA polymerase sigma-70 factor, ECF subfamily